MASSGFLNRLRRRQFSLVCRAARRGPDRLNRREEMQMAETNEDVRRVLQIRLRALGDPAQVLALIRSAAPFYKTMGGAGFRVLQNVDEPAQLLVEIDY